MGLCAKDEEAASLEFVSLYRRYGYSQYRMNKFEEYELYVRNKDFLVSDSVITFTDTNGKLMALKPDVTLSIIKNGKDAPDLVQKVYYCENVYRVSKGTRSFKEIMQVGLECIGAIDDYTIYEVLLLAAESLARISPEYVLDVSQLNIVSKAIDLLGVSQEGKKALVKCVGEKNAHGIRAVCRGESADGDAAELLLQIVDSGSAPEEALGRIRSFSASERFAPELDQLERILGLFGAGAHRGHIRLDFSVMNDMNYYGGIAFNGFVPGLPNSILSGGQYDRLMQKMKRRAGAVGFAVYLDMLELLRSAEDDFDTDIVLLYDRDVPLEKLRDAVSMLTSGGSRVLAQKALPEKIRCKRLLRLGEGGVEILAQYA